MIPPIYETCQADAGVVAAFGKRIFQDEAPANTITPYAVWRAFGIPENIIDGNPKIDGWSVDVAVYAENTKAAREAAEELRDALQSVAYINSLGS